MTKDDHFQNRFGNAHQHGHLFVNLAAFAALRRLFPVRLGDFDGGVERLERQLVLVLVQLQIARHHNFAIAGSAEQQLDRSFFFAIITRTTTTTTTTTKKRFNLSLLSGRRVWDRE